MQEREREKERGSERKECEQTRRRDRVCEQKQKRLIDRERASKNKSD